ncbi:hypothetical protein PALA39_03989 [Pseudomonas aeruginosa]|nr:hypothetical protein PALA39_03989 [Pseudomonas aeruginosa]
MKHEILEKNVGLLALCMAVAVSIGGLTQIVPLFFQDVTNTPVEGMKPYTALQLEGRDIYIREGCVGCHSQMIRPFRARNRTLRPLLGGRRERLGPPLPVGFQAYRSGPGPRR